LDDGCGGIVLVVRPATGNIARGEDERGIYRHGREWSAGLGVLLIG
jgi:hypothetical protein